MAIANSASSSNPTDDAEERIEHALDLERESAKPEELLGVRVEHELLDGRVGDDGFGQLHHASATRAAVHLERDDASLESPMAATQQVRQAGGGHDQPALASGVPARPADELLALASSPHVQRDGVHDGATEDVEGLHQRYVSPGAGIGVTRRERQAIARAPDARSGT